MGKQCMHTENWKTESDVIFVFRLVPLTISGFSFGFWIANKINKAVTNKLDSYSSLQSPELNIL